MTPDQLLQGFRDGRWMPLRGAEALPQQLLPEESHLGAAPIRASWASPTFSELLSLET